MIQSQSDIANRLFSGFFLGEVVKHCKDGKLKVFLPGVYPEEWKTDTSKLPDCILMTPLFGGSNKGNGVFSYPNYNTIVVCYLLNNDCNYPVAIGALLGGASSSLGNSEPGSMYGKCRGEITPSTLSAGTDAFKHIINVGTTKIEISETGIIDIYTHKQPDSDDIKKQALSALPNCLITINGALGTVSISSTTSINVLAPDVTLSASTKLKLLSKDIDIIALDGKLSMKSDTYVNSAKAISANSPYIGLDASDGCYIFSSKTDACIYRY